ncbi:MAG: multidrug efflux SMR transporter [Chitinophagales bacterium]|nr:multidrug efflux SMR transporter [Chitinophagales bacterium]MCZ2392762.1 multidrug efflux SMR transporter [Chitinophagales bacterium]
MNAYLSLFIAIILETAATSLLKASEQYTRPIPTILSISGYIATFYFLSISLKTIPVGIAYAIWSGVGIILITWIGLIVFKQKIDLPAIIGILFIIAGVLTINLFSKSSV